ncbi:MAG: hypothetical protein M3125_02665, partial [Gemmatimonadota bacterium]|nr:hypothetical protein [Gemmatimonadota bacterium]
MRVLRFALVISMVWPASLAAQENPALRRAVSAYRDLEYGQAITLCKQALRERLRAEDQVRAYEILGFAFAALDSARQATDAFKELVLLSPDRELDPARISPKITSLFALARTQVLVVRRLELDSTRIIAGTQNANFAFSVTRSARVRARITGGGRDVVIDDSRIDGAVRIQWNGLMADGSPAPTGSYRLVVEATAGRDSYAASLPIRIVASSVDTVEHLTALPGYELLPETVIPPRSWRPLMLASAAAGVMAGASFALENGRLTGGGRREILSVGVGTIALGML